jgi:hypothetical protein
VQPQVPQLVLPAEVVVARLETLIMQRVVPELQIKDIQVETLALLVQEAVVDTPAVEVVVQLALVQTLQQLQLEMEEMD